MDLNKIKTIVKDAFKKYYTTDEKLVYLGGSDHINHCGFIITDSGAYEVVAKFNVSPTNVYEATHYRANSRWQLEHWEKFVEYIEKALYQGDK